MSLTKDQLQYQVEELVDHSSLFDVLIALAETASYKAEHVSSNWQDKVLAAAWAKAAQYLEQTAHRAPINRLTELSGSVLKS
jgi:hypothetical protein